MRAWVLVAFSNIVPEVFRVPVMLLPWHLLDALP